MDHFELVSEYKPTGDQPEAIKELEGRAGADGPGGKTGRGRVSNVAHASHL